MTTLSSNQTHITSQLIAGVNGFSLRTGGVSQPPFESLNLSTKWGDDEAAVRSNLARLAESAGAKNEAFFVADQVHGRNVHIVREHDTPQSVMSIQADALVTERRGVLLAVRTADCVPVLLRHDLGPIAAAHAGWRGMVNGVITATLDALSELGALPEGLSAAIGPHICAACFEVGDEVATEFDRTAPSCVLRESGKKPHVDLGAAAHLQLLESGISPARIERLSGCTFHEPERFFSFRRNQQKTGLHLSFIGR